MKRQVVLIIVFLILGAIVNVAVAWGFAMWGSYMFTSHQFYSHWEEPRWLCSVSHGVGMTRISFVPDNGNWGGDRSLPDEFTIPYWSRIHTPPTAAIFDDQSMPWFDERAYGWPWRSTIGEMCNRQPIRNWVVTDGMEILRRNNGSPYPFRLLPVRAIWPGFALNTISYALLLWLLFIAPFAARRMIRRRRGQCEKCAYPIGVSPVCTECGAVVSRRPGP